jgi:hypothetical protein
MMRIFIFLLILSFVRSTNAQWNTDTLQHTYLTNGALDSLAKSAVFLSQPFYFQHYDYRSIDLFWHNQMGDFSVPKNIKNAVFSALPHIGFAYQFGTQATQWLKADYHQSFQGNWLVNASIQNASTAGFYRNANFKNGQYTFLVQRSQTRVPIKLWAHFHNETRNWTGGVLDPSQANTFPNDFLATLKSNANTNRRTQEILFDMAFPLSKDSSGKQRLQIQSGLTRLNRTYLESGNLSAAYPTLFFDSLNTADVFKRFAVHQRAGWSLYHNLNRNLNFGLEAQYWRYKDTLFRSDTLETNIYDDLNWQYGGLQIRHQGTFNLTGAANGWKSYLSVKGDLWGTRFDFTHHWIRWLPLPEQRQFSSNAEIFAFNNPTLQSQQKFEISANKTLLNIKLKAILRQDFFNNWYYFNQTAGRWDNTDELSKFSTSSLQFLAQKNWTHWQIEGRYRFALHSLSLDFIPQNIAGAKVQWKGGIFKAKKLQSVLSTDIQWQSKSIGVGFLPHVDAIDWNTNVLSNNGFLNASIMAGFEVSTFRFFVCAENLGYFWSDKSTQWLRGYTYPGMQLRIGITWDFWN